MDFFSFLRKRRLCEARSLNTVLYFVVNETSLSFRPFGQQIKDLLKMSALATNRSPIISQIQDDKSCCFLVRSV